jgi:hypothetical protein
VSRFDHAFLAGAYRRIQAAILVLTSAVAVGAYVQYGIGPSVGVVLGGAIALLNFLWLKQSMIGLTNRFAEVAQPKEKPRTLGLVLRFFLRYGAIAVATFVTIKGSAASAYGVMVGLLLSVPALLFEALYETWHALRNES